MSASNNDLADQEDQEEIEWEVKEVIDKRVTEDNKVEYLLKWKNWDGPPTWEVEDNCDCVLLIRKFERKREQREKKQKQKETARKQSQPSTSRSLSYSQSPRRSVRLKKNIEVITLTCSSGSDPDVIDETADQSGRSYAEQNDPDINTEPDLHDRNLAVDQNSVDREIITPDIDERTINDRKLSLEEIVGFVKDREMFVMVKWRGLNNLEKVPVRVMRRYFCNDILEFFLGKIKWIS